MAEIFKLVGSLRGTSAKNLHFTQIESRKVMLTFARVSIFTAFLRLLSHSKARGNSRKNGGDNEGQSEPRLLVDGCGTSETKKKATCFLSMVCLQTPFKSGPRLCSKAQK